MRSAAQSSDAVVYVYGVARGDALAGRAAPLVEGIIPGTPVELLPMGNLALVMNRASRDVFVPADADAACDVELATERALAHHRVLASLALVCTVAPVKFGALCGNMNDVLTLFARSEGAFERALDRVAGAQEWGIKLFADVEACRNAAGNAPAVVALKAEIAAASQGKAFFLAKKLRTAIDQDVRGRLDVLVDNVHRHLAYQAREAAPNPIRQRSAVPANGNAPRLILDSAYLVDRDREAEFHQALADLGGVLTAEGLALKLTGPWPPYSFASIDTEGAADG